MNEDSLSLQEVTLKGKKVLFAVVCDGIGGLWGGEKASGFVAERMTEWFYKEAIGLLKKKKGGRRILQSGIRSLYACNEELSDFGRRRQRKLGTAVTVLLLDGGRYFLWHSGDTRAYRIGKRAGKIKRLTKDHIEEGQALNRCVGSFIWQEPDTLTGHLRKGESLFMCSDGFRNRISEERLGETLQGREIRTREQIFLRLKEIADFVKRHGERDNISAALIRLL